MELEFFQDILFDLINDCDQYEPADLTVEDQEHRIIATLQSGTVLEIKLRNISQPDR